MPDYTLTFQEGHEAEPFLFRTSDDRTALAIAAKHLGLTLEGGPPTWAAFRQKGAESLFRGKENISKNYDTQH